MDHNRAISAFVVTTCNNNNYHYYYIIVFYIITVFCGSKKPHRRIALVLCTSLYDDCAAMRMLWVHARSDRLKIYYCPLIKIMLLYHIYMCVRNICFHIEHDAYLHNVIMWLVDDSLLLNYNNVFFTVFFKRFLYSYLYIFM